MRISEAMLRNIDPGDNVRPLTCSADKNDRAAVKEVWATHDQHKLVERVNQLTLIAACDAAIDDAPASRPAQNICVICSRQMIMDEDLQKVVGDEGVLGKAWLPMLRRMICTDRTCIKTERRADET